MNEITRWFNELDQLLRGDKTRQLVQGRSTELVRVNVCLISSIVLGMAYGMFMGLYAVLTRTPASWEQWIATSIKVPCLFLLTLGVTLPSLYVFSALLEVQLRFSDVLRVLLAAITVNLCVLAAFGPITGFFTLSTTSYAFMKLLNVVFFTIGGVLGLGFLVRVVELMEARQEAGSGAIAQPVAPAARPPQLPGSSPSSPGPGPETSRVKTVLWIWLVVYALVGAQMGWVLRPFVGDPEQAFQVFRAREANVFIDVARSIGHLLQ